MIRLRSDAAPLHDATENEVTINRGSKFTFVTAASSVGLSGGLLGLTRRTFALSGVSTPASGAGASTDKTDVTCQYLGHVHVPRRCETGLRMPADGALRRTAQKGSELRACLTNSTPACKTGELSEYCYASGRRLRSPKHEGGDTRRQTICCDYERGAL
jgi:hypothetical protein